LHRSSLILRRNTGVKADIGISAGDLALAA
jgi:hypothetical protein